MTNGAIGNAARRPVCRDRERPRTSSRVPSAARQARPNVTSTENRPGARIAWKPNTHFCRNA